MALENPPWGQERIANELLVKLGIQISPRTVRKYLPKPPVGRPRADQRWSTFLKNPARASGQPPAIRCEASPCLTPPPSADGARQRRDPPRIDGGASGCRGWQELGYRG